MAFENTTKRSSFGGGVAFENTTKRYNKKAAPIITLTLHKNAKNYPR
ncbi:hypothetical protein HMPREF1397_01014 [Helicobacter pylori GAM115Ai]|nr:hypothetical protein HMPREF1397_01014 [Helicobacter pylori GAM115Ai]